MKKQVTMTLLAVGIAGVNLALAQRDTRPYDAGRSGRPDASRPARQPGASNEPYERALINAYKTGYRDGLETGRQLNRTSAPLPGVTDRNGRSETRSATRSATRSEIPYGNRDLIDRHEYDRLRNELAAVKRENEQLERKASRYQAFTGGFYAGVNTTRFLGENTGENDLSGRLGYQAGVFTRFGGRIYGQLGAEYFATSSNYFTPGDGQSLENITGRINTQWLQIPALVGVKLAQSKRGISAVRLAAGAEYANRLGGSNTINLDNNEIRSGTFLALGNLGFDVGPLLIDFIYHHGLSDAIRGYANSQRRSVSVNVGFKF